MRGKIEESNLNRRDDDLNCIYNTIATFLQHQNFEQTCEIFKEECASRGFSRQHQHNEKKKQNPINHQIVDERVNNHDEALLAPSGVTYFFKEEKAKSDEAVAENSVPSSIRETFNDFLELKERFLDLQEKHRILMSELEEKTRYLDQMIPLLTSTSTLCEEQINNHQDDDYVKILKNDSEFSTNSATTITDDLFDMVEDYNRRKILPEEVKRVTKENNHSGETSYHTDDICIPHKAMAIEEFSIIKSTSLDIENTRKKQDPKILTADNKDSVDSVAVTILSDQDLTKSSEYSLLDNKEILPNYISNEPQFLFATRKTNQIQSAPTKLEKGDENEGVENMSKTKVVCFSKPLTPKKPFMEGETYRFDFNRLKNDLSNVRQDSLHRSLILQALRWKLTRSTSNERFRTINSYIENDLLKIHDPQMKPLYIDNSDGNIFDEALSRLINTLACFKQGRDYLCSSDTLVKKYLAPKVNKIVEKHEKITTTFEMQVVTLQKLSIRKEQRKSMIDQGLLQTISTLLSERRDEMSSYCLEYSCALFMNLCLEEDAKIKCCKDPKPIIHVFSCLLKGVQEVYMPYVSGALYSVLSEQSVREEALRQQIDLVVFHLMRNTKDKYVKKQLEFIIRSRFRGEGANFTCNENGPVEEIDLLEPELDQKENIGGKSSNVDVLEIYRLREDGNPTNHRQDNIDSLGQTPGLKSRKTSPNVVATNKSKIRFDAEVSTDNKIGFKSVIMYNHPFEELLSSGAIEICNCVGAAKYDCGCYEAIKRSVESDDLATPRSNKIFRENQQQGRHVSLFSSGPLETTQNSIVEKNKSNANTQSMRKKS